ncbi:MAG TPA: aldehyde dehydrogenase family protein, partial [Actinomycetes bacterium]|nr:aldehyde dehydrogenase family protein [Actinomycetes bacterium]
MGAGSHFIDGKRVDSSAGPTHDVIDPSNSQVIETVTLAGPKEVDAAVSAAKNAFPGWSTATPGSRSTALTEFARLLDERATDFAAVESRQAGKPIRLATEFDVPGTVDNTAFFAGAARNLEGKAAGEYSPNHTSFIRREPVGVIGSIAPWNYPLQMAAWKVLPAIAAGNTIVLKPAELTPLTSIMFAEAAFDAGIPAGVVNVITGRGSVAGEHLIAHADVSMVSFTGSTPIGQQVMQTASGTLKRVHLELGGKAPFLVFDDADLDAAIQGAVAGSLINSGQDCTAATRAYVQRPLYEAFVQGVADVMGTVRLGPTADPATDQGPLISRKQQERVAGYVERARGYGAKVVRGGAIPGGELAKGSYYEPTLVVDAAQDSEIVQ